MPTRSTPRGLVVVIVVGAVCFLSSTVYTQLHARDIDEAATSIAGNATPSIEILASLRSELHQLLLSLSQAISTPPLAAKKSKEVLALEHRLDEELLRYRGLPRYPGERSLEEDVERRVGELKKAIDQTLAESAEGNAAAAHHTFDTDVNLTAELTRVAVLNDIALNSRHAGELAERIQHSRTAEVNIAFALDGASLLLMTLGVALALAVERRYERLTESHEALLQRRAEELELFSGRVAHDILSPLQAMAIFLQLTQAPDALAPRLLNARERAQSAVLRVKRMVNDLLEFARAGARPKPGSASDASRLLPQLIQELRPEAEAEEISLETRIDPALEVACSEGVLTSLVQNLVRNAIKYMGDSPERRVELRAAARGQSIRIEVQDSGPGLPSGVEDQIFEPYVRGHGAERPGIGLGLATVKRLAESHAGRVGVSSTARGCLFWFELPRATAQSPTRAELSPAPAPPVGN